MDGWLSAAAEKLKIRAQVREFCTKWQGWRHYFHEGDEE